MILIKEIQSFQPYSLSQSFFHPSPLRYGSEPKGTQIPITDHLFGTMNENEIWI